MSDRAELPERSLFGLAWPILISGQLNTLQWVIATFWVARLGGTLGLAVVALVRPLTQIVSRILAVIAAGAGSEIARDIGAGSGRAGIHARNALASQVMVALPLCVIGLVIASPLASALGDGDVARVLRWYLLPFSLGIPINAAAEVVLMAVIATGWTRLSLWRILGMLALEFTLTPLFMATLGFGVIGSPIAEVSAELICLVLILLLLRRTAESLGLAGWSSGGWSIEFGTLKKFAAIGAPPEVARIISFAVMMILTQLLRARGDSALAALALAMQVIYIVLAVTWSLAAATGILVGQRIGAGQPARAWAAIRSALLSTVGLGVVLWLVLPMLRPVIELVSDDPIVVAKTMEILGLAKWGMLVLGSWQVLASSYVAVGRSGWAGLFMAISECAGAVAGILADDPVRGVGYWFIVANVGKLVLLGTLLPRIVPSDR